MRSQVHQLSLYIEETTINDSNEQDESLNFNQIWNIPKFLFMYRAEVKR